MKKVVWAFGSVFIVISILLVIIVKRGVIVRPQPLIKPTVIISNFEPVARHVALRMFPEFQSQDYIVWNLNFDNSEAQLFKDQILIEYQKMFQKPVHILTEGQALEDCQRPCWIFSKQVYQLEDKRIDRKVEVNWVEFDQVEPIPDSCMNKKILDSYCIQFVSLKSVERKLKDKNARYFFLHKYMDQSFHLFIQNSKK